MFNYNIWNFLKFRFFYGQNGAWMIRENCAEAIYFSGESGNYAMVLHHFLRIQMRDI
jgi:hypothetical protein